MHVFEVSVNKRVNNGADLDRIIMAVQTCSFCNTWTLSGWKTSCFVRV